MHTNLTPDEAPGHRPGSPEHARANRPRALLLIIAMALACLAAIGPSQSALASEFNPKPVVNATQSCVGDPAQLVITLHLTNAGNADAAFHVDAAIDGVHQTADFLVAGGAEEHPSYVGIEGKSIDVVVTSSDDASLHFEQYAAHVDCLADPTASIAIECPATIGGQANVVYGYANPSAVPAYFEFMAPPNGGSSFGWDVSNQPNTVTTDYAVDESTHVNVSVLADNVTIATLDQTVHCLPDQHHVVVSKKVLGSPPGNPAFDFRVECGKNGTIDTIIDAFQLHDGESKSVAMPAGQQCVANELSPPAGHYFIAHSLDGGPSEETTGTFGFSSDSDHTVAFTNTYRPDHVLTVTKHVVGGAPGQTFHFAAECLYEGSPVTTPFDLADGQSHAVLLDYHITSCTVTEADPGKGWTTTHALDAKAPIDGRTETVTNDQYDHTLAFVNTLPAAPTIPTTTVPADTIPTPTVPGTIPEATTTSTTPTTPTTVPPTIPDPSTTTPSTSTTVLLTSVPTPLVPSTAPDSEVLAASIPATVTAAPALARTGANLAPLTLIGTLLIGSGLLLLASLRRQRRRTA